MNEQNSISRLEPFAKARGSNGAADPEPWVAWLKRAGPMVLVLALLACFAYGGHRTGWTVPRFADLLGASNSANDDWCENHGVPESICVECNESLLPKLKTSWCRKHGVHHCQQ